MKTLGGILIGLVLALVLTSLAGETPLVVMDVYYRSIFGSWYDFGMTLAYMVPLLLSGLAVGLAYQAGLFNIGVEGQLTVGALAAAACGIVFADLPKPFAPILAIMAAAAAGALWAAIAGWLLVKRGAHEVITTIMLNFVAAGLASHVTLEWLRNPDSQSPETAIVGPGFRTPAFAIFDDAPLGWWIFFALALAVFLGILLRRAVVGFEWRVAGQSAETAQAQGMSVGKLKFAALAAAGAIAGTAGLQDVFTYAERFRLGFSPGYGFLGIAVALLVGARPFPMILSSFLFAALYKGATDLEFETAFVTKEFAVIIQGMMLLFAAAGGLWTRRPQKQEKAAR